MRRHRPRARRRCSAGPRFEILPARRDRGAGARAPPTDVKVAVTASPGKGLEATLDAQRAARRRRLLQSSRTCRRGSCATGRTSQEVGRPAARRRRPRAVRPGRRRRGAGQVPQRGRPARRWERRCAQFDEIGITGYPESHHLISDEETIQAMFAKAPMATCIISQICFDPDVIAGWIREVRRRGTHLPIWIGLPGTVDYAKLVRISMKIGLGESARFLRHHGNWMSRLMTRQFKPDPLLRGLALAGRRPGGRGRRLPPLHVQRGGPHRALAQGGAEAAGGARRPRSRRAASRRGSRRTTAARAAGSGLVVALVRGSPARGRAASARTGPAPKARGCRSSAQPLARTSRARGPRRSSAMRFAEQVDDGAERRRRAPRRARPRARASRPPAATTSHSSGPEPQRAPAAHRRPPSCSARTRQRRSRGAGLDRATARALAADARAHADLRRRSRSRCGAARAAQPSRRAPLRVVEDGLGDRRGDDPVGERRVHASGRAARGRPRAAPARTCGRARRCR